ncbi:MAG TPA: PilZ domain-containing protein [Candidatus Hydrogenedentes bacterium]|mgnify:CR=1 FL=1|nr:PilZ domain-containing protein [Candidatus Hydrogenedentota bacterium]HOK90127.1 PilZ domain-containing protein [Candidatus Hydrogenedentota bacterium]HOV61766.1 PilZ domain-containing protein [Candidatus Hydrogenedentota bacterium]
MRDGIEERRKYPRSRRRHEIIADSHAGPALLNHVDNISASGVLCHTVDPIPLMTRIGITLVLPKPREHKIEAEGVVVRCERDDVGDDHFHVAIFFTRLSPEDREAIEEYVRYDHDQPEESDA